MRLIARCHPALEGLLPRPVPAARALPDWLRDMPSEVPAEALGGASVRTLKHCPPLIDALSLGLLIPLAADLAVSAEGLSWDWSPPPLPDDLLTRAPIGVHVPEQAIGGPVALDGRSVIKFINFWTLEVPEGWSILFTHPLNREDLPFRTLSGVVDCDHFAHGYVHFPAIWTDPAFRGVLPAGTPVAQAIAVPREETQFAVEVQADAERAASRAIQEELQTARGVYRKRFRDRSRS